MKFRTVFVVFLLFSFPLIGFGQASGFRGQRELLPITQYGKFKNHFPSPQAAIFSFSGLSGREMKEIPEVQFVSAEDVRLSFDILLGQDGRVKYVKGSRVAPEWHEFWKGGINALYEALFTPKVGGDEWVKVDILIPRVQ